MMAVNKVYKELATKMEAGYSDRFIRILEASFTPDEAVICRELFEPATAKELSVRLKMPEKEVVKALNSLVDKGALTRGQTQFAFHKTVLAYHHESVGDTAPHSGPLALSTEIKDMWKDYFFNEWSYEFLKHTEQMIKMSGKNLPISPSIESLERSKHLNKADIMIEEDFKKRIENARSRIIAPCGCRISWGHRNHANGDVPALTCFATFDRPRGEYYYNKPGRVLKELNVQESIDIALACEEAGLVHWGDCYCCDCCCENLFPITRDKRYELMTPNRFAAVIDEDKCKGCQVCVTRCKFDAIEMKPVRGTKKFKAWVNPEKCKGCGVCVIKCKQDAMEMKIVRPPEYLKPPPPPGAKKGGAPVHVIPVWGHYNLK
jgi:Pyruvate/2-oxoacid:ferredoxin oxidoreductase delta subunit